MAMFCFKDICLKGSISNSDFSICVQSTQTPHQDSWKCDSQSLGDPLHCCLQLQLIKNRVQREMPVPDTLIQVKHLLPFLKHHPNFPSALDRNIPLPIQPCCWKRLNSLYNVQNQILRRSNGHWCPEPRSSGLLSAAEWTVPGPSAQGQPHETELNNGTKSYREVEGKPTALPGWGGEGML